MSTFPIFNTFQRVGSFPITDTEVFDTIASLQDYALSNPTAYAGQQCSVISGDNTLSYQINKDKSITLISKTNSVVLERVPTDECCTYIKFGGTKYLDGNKYILASTHFDNYVIYWGDDEPSVSDRIPMHIDFLGSDMAFDILEDNSPLSFTIKSTSGGVALLPPSLGTASEDLTILEYYAGLNITYKEELKIPNNNKISLNSVSGLYDELGRLRPNNSIYYKTELSKINIEFVNGYIKIPTTVPIYNKYISNVIVKYKSKLGFEFIAPTIIYPHSEIITTTSVWEDIPNCFYISDNNGKFNKFTDWNKLSVEYNLSSSSINITGDVYNSDICTKIVLQDSSKAHVDYMMAYCTLELEGFDINKVVRTIYDLPPNSNTYVISIQPFYPKYMKDNESTIIAYAYGNGLTGMKDTILPNHIIVVPHYGNVFEEHDNGLLSDDSFYDNQIYVGSHNSSDGWHLSYGRGMEFSVDGELLPVKGHGSQSYSTGFVSYQLLQIKEATNADWFTIRAAARATASNNGVWDKYTGFGHINVAATIQYIEDNYSTASINLANILANSISIPNGIYYNDIKDNTPLPKKYSGFQIGQRYLGGVIVRINNDGISGLISSYSEHSCNYATALSTYGTIGNYTENGYSNWRLPTIGELELVVKHSKNEGYLLGDMNNDGIINQVDLDEIQKGNSLFADTTWSNWDTYWKRGDVNQDSFIDGSDISAIEKLLIDDDGRGTGGVQSLKYNNYWSCTEHDTLNMQTYHRPVITQNGYKLDGTPIFEVAEPYLQNILKTDIIGVRLVRDF